MRYVFFGTPQFAATILNHLVAHGLSPQGVVTQPDKPIKRSKQLIASPVKEIAISLGCPVMQPVKMRDPAFLETLSQLNADLFITAAYGRILPEVILEMPKIAAINVHASLLPEYRGANPVRAAIADGKTITGVTIMHMVKEMDAGDMIVTKEVPIAPESDFGQLEKLLADKGAEALLEAIPLLMEGTAERSQQDTSRVTFAPKLEKEDCIIDCSQIPIVVQNKIRSLSPYPGGYVMVNQNGVNKRLKIFEVAHSTESCSQNKIRFDKTGMWIGCGSGSLEIRQLQLEGKKRMFVKEFLKGTSSGQWDII